MNVEEAVASSVKGEALALNAEGRKLGYAKGAEAHLSPRKRRKRNCQPVVTLYATRVKGRGLDSKHVRLDKADAPTRERILALDWEPVEPLQVVDRLASMFRRGRIQV